MWCRMMRSKRTNKTPKKKLASKGVSIFFTIRGCKSRWVAQMRNDVCSGRLQMCDDVCLMGGYKWAVI